MCFVDESTVQRWHALRGGLRAGAIYSPFTIMNPISCAGGGALCEVGKGRTTAHVYYVIGPWGDCGITAWWGIRSRGTSRLLDQ
jgi:hypothetical protein